MSILVLAAAVASLQAPAPADLAGRWEGALALPGGARLNLVMRVEGQGETARAVLDSPDQNANDMVIEGLSETGGVVRFAVPSVGGRFEGRRSDDGGTLTGAWSQGGGSLPLVLTRTGEATTVAAPLRPQTPVAPFPYRAEEVAYDNPDAPGVRLGGTLTLPDGPGPHPAVLLITGSGPQDRDETVFGHKPFQVLADALSRRGLAVLRVDDRGVRASTGDFASGTSRDFAGDALAGVRFLEGRSDIDPARIGLVGHSEGATVAPLVVETAPDVAWVVLIAGPAVTGGDLIVEQTRRIATASGAPASVVEAGAAQQAALMAAVSKNATDGLAAMREVEALLVASGALEAQARTAAEGLASPWYRWFVAHDPAPSLAALTIPVLAVYGGKDVQVPSDQNAKALRRILPSAEVMIAPDANHLMQTAVTGLPAEYATIEETLSPVVLDRIVDWTARNSGLPDR